MLVFPNKLSNIYPSTDENIQAVLLFYFKDRWPYLNKSDNYPKIKKGLLDLLGLSMNQLEFCCRILKYNIEYFDGVIKKYESLDQLHNLLTYTKSAFTQPNILNPDPNNSLGSRDRITLAYRNYILKNYQSDKNS